MSLEISEMREDVQLSTLGLAVAAVFNGLTGLSIFSDLIRPVTTHATLSPVGWTMTASAFGFTLSALLALFGLTRQGGWGAAETAAPSELKRLAAIRRTWLGASVKVTIVSLVLIPAAVVQVIG